MWRRGLLWFYVAGALVALSIGTLGGWQEFVQNQAQHGEPATLIEFAPMWVWEVVGSLWDEFFIAATMVVATAHLIYRGSPESK